MAGKCKKYKNLLLIEKNKISLIYKIQWSTNQKAI